MLVGGARTLVLRKSAPEVGTAVRPPEGNPLSQSKEGAAGAAVRGPRRTALTLPVWEDPARLQRQAPVAEPGRQLDRKKSRGSSLLILSRRRTAFQELMSFPRRSTPIPRTTWGIRRLPIEGTASESPTMAGLLDSAPDVQAKEGLTMAGLLNSAKAVPAEKGLTMAGLLDSAPDVQAKEGLTMAGLLDSAKAAPAEKGLTMAGLLDSVDQPQERRELILAAAQPSGRTGRRDGIAGTVQTSADSGLTLRRQAAEPEVQPEKPATAPEPATTVRSRPHRRTETGSSEPATDRPARDVTDFKGWEIEFLASRVFIYLQRKLDIERERHGQAGFNRWL